MIHPRPLLSVSTIMCYVEIYRAREVSPNLGHSLRDFANRKHILMTYITQLHRNDLMCDVSGKSSWNRRGNEKGGVTRELAKINGTRGSTKVKFDRPTRMRVSKVAKSKRYSVLIDVGD